MPTIKYKGFDIYFDSLEDALAAVDRFNGAVPSGEDAKLGATGAKVDGRWTVSRFKDYIGRLSKPQLQMLHELVRMPHGRNAKDLAPSLGLDTPKAFGPILGAMSRHAKRAGIAFEDVMTSSRIDVGREKILEFKATPAFLKIAAEAGWKIGE